MTEDAHSDADDVDPRCGQEDPSVHCPEHDAWVPFTTDDASGQTTPAPAMTADDVSRQGRSPTPTTTHGDAVVRQESGMRYPAEVLDEREDDGTMPESLDALREAVVGHRIVSVEDNVTVPDRYYGTTTGTVITLDNGKRVLLVGGSDCCAYTELESFRLHPERIQHAVAGVGTTDGFTTWHIFADHGDIMEMKVGWSCGNPFYYGYGFTITVEDLAAAPSRAATPGGSALSQRVDAAGAAGLAGALKSASVAIVRGVRRDR